MHHEAADRVTNVHFRRGDDTVEEHEAALMTILGGSACLGSS
jgi:hypothetical protein